MRNCADRVKVAGMYSDPDGYRTPGQLVRGLLAQREWSQRVLAVVLGIHETTINKIVSDRQPISAEMALMLSEVFHVEPDRLLLLQQSYDLALAKLSARPDPGRRTRAQLFGGLPVAEMIKRRWLRADDVRDVKVVEDELARFFGVETPDEIEILPHAAKKSQVSPEVTPAQLAWLYRVKQLASLSLVPKFTEFGARRILKDLSGLLIAREAARKVPRLLAESGIRFVLVEALPGSKIDGVCFWIKGAMPVIGMTIRYDRIDNFWFVLRHELEHVLRGDGRTQDVLDTELEGERAGVGADLSEQERNANAAAAEFCVPQEKLERFIARKSPYFAERDILGFANTIGVHPGLVAGQLQHRTGRYDLFRKHLVPIRAAVAPSAMVDGWGDVAPVDF